MSTTRTEELERLQLRASRIVTRDYNTPGITLLQQLGWKSLKTRSSIQRLIFVFKCLNCSGPHCFSNYFEKTSHNYRTRRKGKDVILPKVRTEAAKKSLFYLGGKEYNDLPDILKECKTLTIFKQTLLEIF